MTWPNQRRLRGLWPATGRWRVHRYQEPAAGVFGRPAWSWAVISPAGEHVGSSPTWPEAQEAAEHLARHPQDRW